MKIWNSRLTYAVDFARSSEFKIDLCKLETVVRLFHRSKSIGLIFLGSKKITVTLILTSADSSAKLVELGESESLCPFDTHDASIWVIHPYFYDRSRREYMNLVFIEFLHDSIFLFSTHLSMDEADRELRKNRRKSDLHLHRTGDLEGL